LRLLTATRAEGLKAVTVARRARLPARRPGHLPHPPQIALTFSSAGVVRCLVGAGVYLALVAALGVALGALVRSVAGGIALVVLLTLLPVLTDLLPGNWGNDVSPYLPGNAGDAIFALTHDSSTLSPVVGLAVFAGWTAVAVILAAVRLVRTDA
jgi:ABC-2 type transport system permease protein